MKRVKKYRTKKRTTKSRRTNTKKKNKRTRKKSRYNVKNMKGGFGGYAATTPNPFLVYFGGFALIALIAAAVFTNSRKETVSPGAPGSGLRISPPSTGGYTKEEVVKILRDKFSTPPSGGGQSNYDLMVSFDIGMRKGLERILTVPRDSEKEFGRISKELKNFDVNRFFLETLDEVAISSLDELNKNLGSVQLIGSIIGKYEEILQDKLTEKHLDLYSSVIAIQEKVTGAKASKAMRDMKEQFEQKLNSPVGRGDKLESVLDSTRTVGSAYKPTDQVKWFNRNKLRAGEGGHPHVDFGNLDRSSAPKSGLSRIEQDMLSYLSEDSDKSVRGRDTRTSGERLAVRLAGETADSDGEFLAAVRRAVGPVNLPAEWSGVSDDLGVKGVAEQTQQEQSTAERGSMPTHNRRLGALGAHLGVGKAR